MLGAMDFGVTDHGSAPAVNRRRGEEKAVFRFGGSAIVVFGERDKWSPSADLLSSTPGRMSQTLMRLGDCVATARPPR